MRLNLLISDEWSIYEIDATGRTIEDEYLKHGDDESGLFALFEHVVSQKLGPTNLSTSMSHEIDKSNSIYEFVKGRYRVAYFIDDGKLIICTHCFYKKTGKTSKIDRQQAIRLKKSYLLAKSKKELEFSEEED